MQRVRVTVKHNPDDPIDDLRWAARVRRDLWAHSPVEIDPDSPRHGTHRDEQKNAFFEFATDRFPEPCQLRGSGTFLFDGELSMYPTMCRIVPRGRRGALSSA